MAKTFLGNEGGMIKSVVSDHSDPDRLTFLSEQDLDATFKSIEFKRGQAMDKDMRPVAEIPGIIVEQMMRDGSWNDPAAIKRWINDPANACFRIWQGRI
jgi:hypothetical protein